MLFLAFLQVLVVSNFGAPSFAAVEITHSLANLALCVGSTFLINDPAKTLAFHFIKL